MELIFRGLYGVLYVSESRAVESLTKGRCMDGKLMGMCAAIAFTYTFLPWAMPRTNNRQQDPSFYMKIKEQGV